MAAVLADAEEMRVLWREEAQLAQVDLEDSLMRAFLPGLGTVQQTHPPVGAGHRQRGVASRGERERFRSAAQAAEGAVDLAAARVQQPEHAVVTARGDQLDVLHRRGGSPARMPGVWGGELAG